MCASHPSTPATPKARTQTWWLQACQVSFTCVHWYDIHPLPIPVCIEWAARICTCTERALCPPGQLFTLHLECFVQVYQCAEFGTASLKIQKLGGSHANKTSRHWHMHVGLSATATLKARIRPWRKHGHRVSFACANWFDLQPHPMFFFLRF